MFVFFFFRIPEIELKNAKGLSNESVNLLKSRLEELAKKHCGEVRHSTGV
jgi:translation initiation factor 2-alpha kinase 4